MAIRRARRSTSPSSRARARVRAKARSQTKRVRGISRIDQPSTRTFGFFVRYGYRHTSAGYRPRFTAFFGDATYGGKRKALAAAERWIRHVERRGKPPVRRAKALTSG